MAIQGLYPSRRQSRWSNPLIVRARLRKARTAAIFAGLFALAAYGVGHLDVAQSQPASAPQLLDTAVDAPNNARKPAAKPASARIIHKFASVQDAAAIIG